MIKRIIEIVMFLSFCFIPFSSFALEGDVNGDGKIGLPEAIFALQVSSGLRAEGLLAIDQSPASQGNMNYPAGAKNVELFQSRVLAEQPVTVDGLRVDLAEVKNFAVTDINDSFSNFRLFLNDQLVSAERCFTIINTSVEAYLLFHKAIELKGTSILKVVADIADSAVSGATLKLEMKSNAFLSPSYSATGNPVSSDRISGSATGSFVEVADSRLLVAYQDGDKETVSGQMYGAFSVIFDNDWDLGDEQITSLEIKGSGTDGFFLTIHMDGFPDVSVREKNGYFIFNDLSFIIPSERRKEATFVFESPQQLFGGQKFSFDILEVEAERTKNGKPVNVMGLPVKAVKFVVID